MQCWWFTRKGKIFREIQFIKHGNCLDFSIFVVVSSRRCEGLSGGYFIEFLMCAFKLISHAFMLDVVSEAP